MTTTRKVVPISSLRRLLKEEGDIKRVSGNSLEMLSAVASHFIADLTTRALKSMQTTSERKTLRGIDISAAASRCDMFDFLIDILPPRQKSTSNFDIIVPPSLIPPQPPPQPQQQEEQKDNEEEEEEEEEVEELGYAPGATLENLMSERTLNLLHNAAADTDGDEEEELFNPSEVIPTDDPIF